jgi:hypothetical protein
MKSNQQDLIEQMQSKRRTKSGPLNIGDLCAAPKVAQAGQGRRNDSGREAKAIVDLRSLGGQVSARAAAYQAAVGRTVGILVIAAFVVAVLMNTSDVANLAVVQVADAQPVATQQGMQANQPGRQNCKESGHIHATGGNCRHTGIIAAVRLWVKKGLRAVGAVVALIASTFAISVQIDLRQGRKRSFSPSG